MNVQQQVLNLIKENGGTATRGQINQLIEFIRPGVYEYYTSGICSKLMKKGFVKQEKTSPNRGPETVFNITPAGKRYIKTGPKFGPKGELSIVGATIPPATITTQKAPTPVEKLISGSIIRDLLLNKFDQLSASERCGLLEIYNIVESKTKTQQQ